MHKVGLGSYMYLLVLACCIVPCALYVNGLGTGCTVHLQVTAVSHWTLLCSIYLARRLYMTWIQRPQSCWIELPSIPCAWHPSVSMKVEAHVSFKELQSSLSMENLPKPSLMLVSQHCLRFRPFSIEPTRSLSRIQLLSLCWSKQPDKRFSSRLKCYIVWISSSTVYPCLISTILSGFHLLLWQFERVWLLLRPGISVVNWHVVVIVRCEPHNPGVVTNRLGKLFYSLPTTLFSPSLRHVTSQPIKSTSLLWMLITNIPSTVGQR